jgi:CDP-glucose 4,6-dehydratase
MHYLVTGHTGFKGAWLIQLLAELGHEVSGISLDPTPRALFTEASLASKLKHDIRIDIRDKSKLAIALKKIQPDVIVHLAAQALVRESYKDPYSTFETNVMGTLNLLESSAQECDPKATLLITTDKVYKNRNKLDGYVESDELGGDDPYSASKAAADIAAQSWIKNFSNHPISIARAGNVVGGGDWATDRIMPDLVNSFISERAPILRYPNAIRPWQHVLDCLNGYLNLLDSMIRNGTSGEWNFGPRININQDVKAVAEAAIDFWGFNGNWELDPEVNPHEARFLLLDSTKARTHLGWKDKLQFNDTIEWTLDFYRNATSGKNVGDLIAEQTRRYIDLD